MEEEDVEEGVGRSGLVLPVSVGSEATEGGAAGPAVFGPGAGPGVEDGDGGKSGERGSAAAVAAVTGARDRCAIVGVIVFALSESSDYVSLFQGPWRMKRM